MVAALDDVVLFDATLNVTVPLPSPDEPLVIVTQAALLDAVQAQPDPLVTLKLPLPPAAAKSWLAGEIA